MNSDRIDRRRDEIEIWLNQVIKIDQLSKHLFKFFNIQLSSYDSSYIKTSEKSDQLANFISSITSTSNNKISTIEKFSFNFFSKKTHLKPHQLKLLIECLIPLCGDEMIGNKSLDFLFKLTTSDYYRDFVIASSQIVIFPAEVLREMKLDEYLTKKRLADSQIQAYSICKIIHGAMGSAFLYDVVRIKQLAHDKEAILVFSNWGVEVKEESKQVGEKVQDWRPLIDLDDKKLSFRFIGRELDIFGFIIVNTSVDRVIDVLTVPTERKKWDLKMQEMIRIPKESGFIIIYSAERKLYEFHTEVSIEKFEKSAKVLFLTKCFQFKRNNTILGNLSSSYQIEINDEFDKDLRVGSNSALRNRIKINWNAHFCENSFNLVREDIFQEATVMQKSFERLVSILEFNEDLNEGEMKNPLLDKFERKKLTKTFSLEDFRFLQ